MPHEVLGKGLQRPVRINQYGGLAVARYEEKVHQSIITILSTSKGERLMRPEFGCDIHSFVFASVDTATLTLIKSAVREALVRWEPRIDVNDVSVVMDSAGGNQLVITVNYTIRATNFAANLVYPFYLQSGT
jgi:phage baseplate assembly protein W